MDIGLGSDKAAFSERKFVLRPQSRGEVQAPKIRISGCARQPHQDPDIWAPTHFLFVFHLRAPLLWAVHLLHLIFSVILCYKLFLYTSTCISQHPQDKIDGGALKNRV